MERWIGTPGNDFHSAGDQNDTLDGRGGDDELFGSGGDDSILGGAGNDSIWGGWDTGNDTIDAGSGDDYVEGEDGDDVIYGGDGNDELHGDLGDNDLDGEDLIYGGADSDVIDGGGGNDTLYGGDGRDTLRGGDGDDYLNPGGNDDEWDWIDGSAGNDTIDYTDNNEMGFQSIGYGSLGTAIEASIDGVANTATVDKGSAGTDTIVDIVNPLSGWGYSFNGSRFGDIINLHLDQDQWIQVQGDSGDDTFNISGSGTVRLAYTRADHGIRLDLAQGRAFDDGFGNVDTINPSLTFFAVIHGDDA